MPYRAVRAADVDAGPGPHPAASPLAQFAVYQVDLPPFARSTPHDHGADGVEDMCAVIAGTGTVVVDGEAVPVESGAFVSVTPDALRHVEAGDAGLVYIAVCSVTHDG
jgi:quercetin dioxygenase-like cupin family protein